MNPGVVLVGPPGSGKTTIGFALAERFGYRFLDREAALLARYGSVDAFVAEKAAAVAEMQRSALAWMAEDAAPWVYESTALTERAFVEELGKAGGFLVRLSITREAALARVAGRADGANLRNSAGAAGAVWDACETEHGTLRFDLVLDVADRAAADLAATFHAAFQARRAS